VSRVVRAQIFKGRICIFDSSIPSSLDRPMCDSFVLPWGDLGLSWARSTLEDTLFLPVVQRFVLLFTNRHV